jgi:hypothetical protein
MLKRFVSLLLVLTFMTLQSGCSLFVPSHETVMVTTSEADADIFINGNFAGKGTVTSSVKRNANVSIMAKKEGFQPATRSISKTLSTTGLVDVVGGFIFLIPFVGLMAPGAWDLSEQNISIMMYEKK